MSRPRSGLTPSPAPLRAKGIEDDAPPLTYTGPSEDGSAQVQRSAGGPSHAVPVGRRHSAGAARSRAPRGQGRQGRGAGPAPTRSPDLKGDDPPAVTVHVRRAQRSRGHAAPRVKCRTPRRRRRRPSAAAPGAASPPRCAVVRVSATTASISAGATSGRSCATGRRRSTTSSTRRSAASANTTAACGGRGSRTIGRAATGRRGDRRGVRRCSAAGVGGGHGGDAGDRAAVRSR